MGVAATSKMKLVLCCLALCATLSFCEDVVSPVTEITMENFVDVVTDGKKHVLVEFYAPWCGECKNVSPEFEKLAALNQDSDDVVIARMDGEAQMVFAKMYKDKKGVAYEGEFTSEAMTSWLSDQTYEAPTLPPREPPKIITREDGTIEMTETFYHYGDGMPPM